MDTSIHLTTIDCMWHGRVLHFFAAKIPCHCYADLQSKFSFIQLEDALASRLGLQRLVMVWLAVT